MELAAAYALFFRDLLSSGDDQFRDAVEPAQQLDHEAMYHIAMRVAAHRTSTYGMADSAARIAYERALKEAHPDLTVMRAAKGHIQSHIRVALDLGVTPQEILEAIEISLPEAGVVAFALPL